MRGIIIDRRFRCAFVSFLEPVLGGAKRVRCKTQGQTDAGEDRRGQERTGRGQGDKDRLPFRLSGVVCGAVRGA